MKLKCLGSSSSGNCYILEGAESKIILDAGISFKKVKVALDFNLDVAGCLITHAHVDHIKHIKGIAGCAIKICSTTGTLNLLKEQGIIMYHRFISYKKAFRVGEFKVMPFESVHDCKEPVNFLIESTVTKERLLFITDTAYCKYKFKNVDYLLIEANHKAELLQKSVEDGVYPSYLADRIRENHMELETTINFIGDNLYKSIVLIHLSDKNSDPLLFRNEVLNKTNNKKVFVAKEGLGIKL